MNNVVAVCACFSKIFGIDRKTDISSCLVILLTITHFTAF